MAKISAYGEREVARYVKAGGDTLVLTAKADGSPGRLLRKWTKGAKFDVLVIVVGHRQNGTPVYDHRKITRERADAFARANGYEARGL